MSRPAKSSTTSPAVRALRSALAALRPRDRFVSYYEAPTYAAKLRALVEGLDVDIDPRTGVELLATFYRADAAILESCDDSDGGVGDVFRIEALERFVHYATLYDDKQRLADLVDDLLETDEYGVRDSLLEGAARYLPEPMLRSLAERWWKATDGPIPRADSVRDWQRGARLVRIEQIARELNDPHLFERARKAHRPKPGTAACVDIANAWLRAGEPATALGWLERIDPGEPFMAEERDTALVEVYRRLERRGELLDLLRRRFHACRSRESLDELLGVMGAERRGEMVAEANEAIRRSVGFATTDAEFLLDCMDAGRAAEYVLERRADVNGDDWPNLLPLARALSDAQQPLGATVIYRALLDTILARAQSRAYRHGAGYWRRLDRLAVGMTEWRGIAPHAEYAASVQERHRRKSSFWKAVATLQMASSRVESARRGGTFA